MSLKWETLSVATCMLLVGLAVAQGPPPVLQEHSITNTTAWETTPRLGNDGISDIVTYTRRTLNPDGSLGPGDIYSQRLDASGAPTGPAVQVTNDGLDNQLNDISGDFIVYTAYDSTSSMSGRIMVYQISTTYLYPGVGSALIIQEPRISGAKVVWREGGATASQVMLYDLSWLGTARDADIIAGPIPPTFTVDIGDRFVVWAEMTNQQQDIFAYDLAAGIRRQLSATPTVIESEPSTSGAWVVWQAYDKGSSQRSIVARNLDTNEERVIAGNATAAFYSPSVDGDIIAYESHVPGSTNVQDVFLYRISTGQTFQVTTGGVDHYLNDVFGNRVAYVDQRTGNEDIYVATFGFESSSTPSCTFLPGIVGCYPFEGNANDFSGNARHGLRHGGSFVADKFGNAGGALALNGVDEYVSVPTWGFDLSEFTLAAIVKVPDFAQDNWILSKGTYYGNYTLMVNGAGGSWPGYAAYQHQTSNAPTNWSARASATPVPLNGFFHLAVTVSATEFRAYVNGRLAGTFLNPTPPMTNGSDLVIGAGGYYQLDRFFKGAIDDLRVYNRALADSEIAELYNRTFNAAPVAEAGPDQAVVAVNSRVTLDGRQSYDEDGDLLTYAWRLSQVPPGSIAALDNPSSEQPGFVADLYGNYVAELIVSDSWAASRPDTVTVSFENLKPVAVAGGNQSVRVLQTVALDGGGSYDPNGDAITYHWTLLSKPAGSNATVQNATAQIASFVPDQHGSYVVNLVVSDGQANSNPDTTTITATLTVSEVTDTLDAAVAAINHLASGSLKNQNMAKTLTNKIGAVLTMIDQGNYAEALDKLQNDILAKTDGCALAGAPDSNDWLVTCQAQGQIYPMIVQTIELLKLF